MMGGVLPSRGDKWRRRLDRAVVPLLSAGLLVGVVTLVALLFDVVSSGASRLSFDLLNNYPSADPGKAGMRSAFWGTFWTVGLSAVVCIPLGIATALYLTEFSENQRLKGLLQFNLANLAGVPSIVFGLVGLSLLTYTMGWGRSIIAGAFTLAFLTLPLVVVSAVEAVKAVPEELRLGAYALGATKLQVAARIIMPRALPMMLTGSILAVSRAIGEAAPILVISGLLFIRRDPASIFDKFTVMPLQIFNWVSRPQPEFRELASAGITVLLLLLLAINAAAIYLRYRYQRRVAA